MAIPVRDRYMEANWSAPAISVATITPADADLANDLRGFYVGGAGNVSVQCPDGSTATFIGVPVGQFIPVLCRRINATGTSATNIVGLL